MKHVAWLFPAVAVAFFALPARAQEARPGEAKEAELPWRDVELRIGLFSAGFRTGLETTNSVGTGLSVNLEDTLDLDDTKLAYRLEGSVALGARHRIHLDYLNVFREGEKSIEREVEIGDTVYPVGARVETESRFQLISLTYGYSIVQDDRLDLAVTFGIHGLRSELDIDAAASNTTRSINVFLPIPLPGLRFDAVLSPGVWLRQRLEIIWLAVGDYAGLLADYTARLEVEVGKGFNVGLGFNSLNARVESKDDDNPGIGYEGKADFSFSGFLLYAGYGF